MSRNDEMSEMSERDVLCLVSDSLAPVALPEPPRLEVIVARGRTVRRRRARRVVPGVLAGMAAALLALMALSAGHQAARQAAPGTGRQRSQAPAAELTAWTVTRQADGDIRVTVRELRDPAGLQRTLRADGVPASVTFFGHQNLACRQYPFNRATLNRVFPPGLRRIHRAVLVSPPTVHLPSGVRPVPEIILIRPSALPRRAGVQLNVRLVTVAPPAHARVYVAAPSLVYASPECTGP